MSFDVNRRYQYLIVVFEDNNSTGVSLSGILFSVMLEKYIVCNVYGLRFPSFEFNSALYITPTYTSSVQEIIM